MKKKREEGRKGEKNGEGKRRGERATCRAPVVY